MPPKKAPLPKISNKDWVRNEIDYFILQKLDEKDLSPNEEADKERLLKRASLDITGSAAFPGHDGQVSCMIHRQMPMRK